MSLRAVTGILHASRADLNLRACLRGGMSFRWSLIRETEFDQEFIGVMNKKIVKLIQNTYKENIEYSVWCTGNESKTIDELEIEINKELVDYFRLNVNLKELYADWSNRDEKFKERVNMFPDVLNGIRVLRQDPVENLFSFICSSNNNIKRITQMVTNLCNHFGEKIGTIDDQDYYAFPSIERLAQSDVEAKLKNLSFGYRGRFIANAAVYLNKNYSEEWLHSLREKSYEETHKELVKIYGVGKKVADCVCLMSMDKLEAIPVDTHVFSIATNQYKFFPHLKQKSGAKKSNNLNDTTYKEIGNRFRDLWGEYAGWTQTVMFIDDLKDFDKVKNESLKKSASSSALKEEKIELKDFLDIKTEGVKVENTIESKIIKSEAVKVENTIESKLIKTEALEVTDLIEAKVIKTEVEHKTDDIETKVIKSEAIEVKQEQLITNLQKRHYSNMTESPAPKNKNKKKKKKRM